MNGTYYVEKIKILKNYHLIVNSLLGQYFFVKDLSNYSGNIDDKQYVFSHRFLNRRKLKYVIQHKTIEKEPDGSIKDILKKRIQNLDNNCVVITRGSYETPSNYYFCFWYGFFTGSKKINYSVNYEKSNRISILGNEKIAEILAVKNAINYALKNSLKRIDIYFHNLEVLDCLYEEQSKESFIRDYREFVWKSEKKIKIVMHKLPN